MKKKLTAVDFRGTPEQEEKLRAVIEKYRGVKGAMMPIHQEAQELYGYLTPEVQRIIALETGTPAEEIYGIVTFYSQFKLNPSGEVAISICLGTACYVKGAGDVLEEVSKQLGVEVGGISADGRFSLEATRCVGACGLAPVMVINNEVYGKMTTDQVASVLAKYKA